MSEPKIPVILDVNNRPPELANSREPTQEARQLQLDDDYQWARQDPLVRKRYGGQVVAVHKRQVLGGGPDHLHAYRAARRRPDCPARKQLAFIVIPDFEAAPDNEFGWCLEDRDVQRRFGGLVAAIHQRRILGAGCDREQAWEAAQLDLQCPAPSEVQFVAIPFILSDDESY